MADSRRIMKVPADPFGRSIDYLRISITDRCNERCLYCMPEGYKGWARKPDHMTAAEILAVAGSATRLGFRKFRLTGGEPLLRPDVVEIAAGIGALPGTASLGLSTNGTRLAPVAAALRDAGVRSVNISLDALDPVVYRQITGGRYDDVMAGIDAALAAGFEMIKLNCVLMRGINESQILPIARFAADHGLLVRFIELMPLTRNDVLDDDNFLPLAAAMSMFAPGVLTPLPDYRPGHGPARYYRWEQTGSRMGFIGALTQHGFCSTCNKLRLTADGKLRPCLGRHGEIDLLARLRDGSATAGESLSQAIANKPENHEFDDCYQPGRPMVAIGG